MAATGAAGAKASMAKAPGRWVSRMAAAPPRPADVHSCSRAISSASFSGEGEVRFVMDSLKLVEGTYKIDVAVHKQDGYPYDYHRLLYTFRMKSPTKDVGVYRPDHTWTFTPNIRFKPVAGGALRTSR